MAASSRLMVIKRQEAYDEEIETEPKIAIVKQKTMELKKEVSRSSPFAYVFDSGSRFTGYYCKIKLMLAALLQTRFYIEMF